LNATEILNSLDNLRKEVRLKFKAITPQEMCVFSTLYELEQNYFEGVEYEQIASKLKLSPSSIRDYIQRLISKGVPILKDKINNKKILLRISPELKKIVTLDTIIKLREL
jgi:predicted transcriptional regulator